MSEAVNRGVILLKVVALLLALRLAGVNASELSGLPLGLALDEVLVLQPQYQPSAELLGNQPCYWLESTPDNGVRLLMQHQQLVRVDVSSQQLELASGIKVGASLSQLIAAYPQGYSEVHPQAPWAEYWYVDVDDNSRLIFDVFDHQLQRYRLGYYAALLTEQGC